MEQFTYTIKDENGIHARPAGLLVKLAGGYKSEIKVSSKGKQADAKRIFSLMGLGIKCGDEVTISCTGEDEKAASAAISEFISANF